MSKRKLRKSRHLKANPTFKELVHAGMERKAKEKSEKTSS
jgi:hypothetical protein